MRKKLIKAGVLLGVFLTALVVSSLIINRGTEDATVDMGDPTLPRVYFSVEGYKINTLFGYVEEMDITAMRDTITPLDAKDSLTLGIEKGKRKSHRSSMKYTPWMGKKYIRLVRWRTFRQRKYRSAWTAPWGRCTGSSAAHDFSDRRKGDLLLYKD